MLGSAMSAGFSSPSVIPAWGVAALVGAVGATLADRFGACTVRGELSGFVRAGSGHCYFNLKDADGAPALLRCAMFRRAASLCDFAPADGQQVLLRGRLSVYEPRGELQFVVEAMLRVGAGALFEQFVRLKVKLEAEGLFDAARKRAPSHFPRRIGVITSPQAAALRDVAITLARRAPHVQLIVYPSPVQGAEAPECLVEALALAARRAEVDTLLLCRGGGSLEDLWSFNDERVVRAVVASPIPVICGVGHETDVTLSDFAADVRAATPTAAAELAAPATRDCESVLQAFAAALRRRVGGALETQLQRVDRLALHLARPAQVLSRHAQRLDALDQRTRTALAAGLQRRAAEHERRLARARLAMAARRQREHSRLESLQARLHALDPKRVLARGYAWLSDVEDRPLSSVHQLHVGQAIRAQWADGRADATVTALRPDDTRDA
jgi:exodeoxyribonuclease VII large subunit